MVTGTGRLRRRSRSMNGPSYCASRMPLYIGEYRSLLQRSAPLRYGCPKIGIRRRGSSNHSKVGEHARALELSARAESLRMTQGSIGAAYTELVMRVWQLLEVG